jgi:hypothetical protein
MKKRILCAYACAQDGDISKAHDLYTTMRWNPVTFWEYADSLGVEVYEFFWNLYYPDNPIA